MRTRFLNTDYFSSSPSLVYGTLGFLNLPVPDNFPPLRVCDGEYDRLLVDPVEDFCLPIGNLPIDAALSKFLFDVVPNRVSVDYEGFEIDESSLGGHFSDEEKNDGDAIEEKATLNFNFIQLETPELDLEMDELLSSKREDLQCLCEVLDIENEPVKFEESDITIQNSNEIQQKIYSVDYISSDYFTENNTLVPENECFRQNQPWLKDARFPILEVDEVNLSVLSSLSMLDKVFTVLETIEPQHTNAESSLIINSQELMGTKDNDLLDVFSTDCCLSTSSQSDMVPEGAICGMDIITILEISNGEGNSQFERGKVAVDYNFTTVPVTFEEFQILDVEISDVFDIFLCLQKAVEPEVCNGMFSKEMNFKNFDELVVSSELAFTDDAFKSLPTPLIYDYEMTRSLDLVYVDILSEIKPQSLSASNDIYLNWNLLEERKHNHEASFCDYPLEEIVTCSVDFKWESSEGDKWVYDFIFSDDSFCEPLVEKRTEPFSGICTLDEHPSVHTSHGLLENPCLKTGAADCGGGGNAKKATLLFKSMSTFDDLSFFMDPQTAMIEENLESRTEAAKTANHQMKSLDSKASCISGGMHPNLETEDMILHSVRPLENIVGLVRNFEKSYLTLVKDESELNSTLSEDKLKLLSISKVKLIDCLRKANVQKTKLADDKTFTFALLLAIKQMTWYMCFFGIHVAYLYLSKLCWSSNPMKLGLHTLYSSLETEHKSVDIDITRSHPSLAVIHGILHSKLSQGNSKALLLAEKVFWSSLKKLLISMGLSYNELNSPSPSANQPNVNEAMFQSKELGLLQISDCLIVSYEQISSSFPLENFNVIVEYGGPNASPRFSFPPELDSFPCFHFIKVELDMSSACGKLSAGVTVPSSLKMVKGDEHETKTGWLEELLNFIPLESVCSAGSSETTKESEFVSLPHESGRKNGIIGQGVLSDQRAVIVMNTKNVDKEMIISRRSSYQKVLALEKEGLQVVERDSDLPVDLMLGSAVCLLWYDCENKNSVASIGASTSSLSWIGDIATNVLTSLSFSFSSCVVVFEGEPTCLATVMDSSDELYAAAGSLGISLQIFCSSSADLTDEILLRCIKSFVDYSLVHAELPESESLAESFLTRFPSVNPLTAQAIISSAGSLLEFMKLPHSIKVQRLQKYHVPEESIELFSSLCRYGAREDSKSVMTDSSSSVSSGHDSDTYQFSGHSGSKKKQYSAEKDDIDLDELGLFVPSKELADAPQLKPSGDFQLDDSWSSRDHDIFHFDPVTEFSEAPLKPSGSNHLNDFWPSKDIGRFDKKSGPGSSSKNACWEKDITDFPVEDNLPGITEQEDWNFPVMDEFKRQNRGCKFSVMRDLNVHDTQNSADYKGEVINVTDSTFPEEDFPFLTGYNRFAPIISHVDEEDVPRKSKLARKLSFSGPLQPNFPRAAEISSSSDRIAMEKDLEKGSSLRGYADNFPAKRQRTLLEEVLTRRSAVSTTELPFREEISHFSGSPLSKAIRSSSPVQGSPWTMEFLNRVRERSSERQQQQQQAFPSYVTSSSALETPGILKKASTKRKSPSILEFFKYKGGNTLGKIQQEKKQKRSKNSSASPKNERFQSPLMSWTPIDKRAKQTLSFTVNGTGSQTKLVWK